MSIRLIVMGIFGLHMIVSVSTAAPAPTTLTPKQIFDAAITNPFDQNNFKAFAGSLPKYNGQYVVEGDVLMSELELRTYLVNAGSVGAPPQPGELIVNCKGGLCDRWPLDNRTITYTIDQSSFGNKFEEISKNMGLAAQDWEKACPVCKLSIRKANGPTEPRRKPAHFVVRHVSDADFIAASFFPSDPESDMVLLVDDSYFGTSFDRIGVLRHEIGHILGYRHEHIEGVPGCVREGGEWQRITPYDYKSVMHYLCGGGGDTKLAISDLDKKGHIAHYKP